MPDCQIEAVFYFVDSLHQMIGMHLFSGNVCHLSTLSNEGQQWSLAKKACHFDNVVDLVSIQSVRRRKQYAIAPSLLQFMTQEHLRIDRVCTFFRYEFVKSVLNCQDAGRCVI